MTAPTEENLVSMFRGLGADERRVLVAIAERVEWTLRRCPLGFGGVWDSLYAATRISIAAALFVEPLILAATEENLVSISRGLSDADRGFVFAIAERLDMGQRQYGRLCIATDRRDWRKELREELLDACVYGAIATLRGTR